MPSSQNPQTGRIRTHERVTNNATILGGGIEINPQHQASVRDTESNRLSKRARQDYRNRIKHIYLFWEEHYPDYFQIGTWNKATDFGRKKQPRSLD